MTMRYFDTAISICVAISGVALGYERLSALHETERVAAKKSAGGARKEVADIRRAKNTAAKVTAEREALNKKLTTEVAALNTGFDAQAGPLDQVVVRAKSTDIYVPLIGLVWMPYRADANKHLRPTWK
jgi:hypothetical protein